MLYLATYRPMTLKQARKLLGIHSKKLSDEQVEKILSQFYTLAEVVSEVVSLRGSKNQTKGIEIGLSGGHNECK